MPSSTAVQWSRAAICCAAQLHSEMTRRARGTLSHNCLLGGWHKADHSKSRHSETARKIECPQPTTALCQAREE